MVRAVTGWGGVPKQRVGAQRIVLIRALRPRHKIISCIGQRLANEQAYARKWRKELGGDISLSIDRSIYIIYIYNRFTDR